MHPDQIIARQAIDGDCHRWAEAVVERASYSVAFDDCVEHAYEVALQNAHDEWWDNSAPEDWEQAREYGPWFCNGQVLQEAA